MNRFGYIYIKEFLLFIGEGRESWGLSLVFNSMNDFILKKFKYKIKVGILCVV